LSLEVGIVGLPRAGKTTLFNAVTHAGVAMHDGKPHVGMAPIADPRLEPVALIESSVKVTPATIRVQDVPGTGAALLGNLRRVDALLLVADGFSPGGNPKRDLEQLELELLVGDRDHVEKRLERVRRQAKSGDPKLRAEALTLDALLTPLDAGGAFGDFPGEVPPELEPLTTKPSLVIENGPRGIDLALELELAELPADEADEFRDGPSALADIAQRLGELLDLITFFTAGDTETRAWTLRRGQTALAAAGEIHSDIARGFIRCEVIRASDFVECGSRAEASRRGLQRLEGRDYVVEDGDVINIRFNTG